MKKKRKEKKKKEFFFEVGAVSAYAVLRGRENPNVTDVYITGWSRI